MSIQPTLLPEVRSWIPDAAPVEVLFWVHSLEVVSGAIAAQSFPLYALVAMFDALDRNTLRASA
jgi:hypothetical protein